jgi:WD40 repeat protein/tRNA A-37 threonylcarbamoyl transferase component Bud32
MSESTPSRPGADRNLLFGILALQMDFIQRDALIAAMHAWVLDKAKPLGQILVEQGALDAGNRAWLEAGVERHLEKHGNDAERSLAAVQLPAPLRHALHRLDDGDVQASLAQLPTPTSARTAAPLPATTADAKSAGQRYQVLRPHGKGGLGEVFVALDQELRREVALKEIRAEHADDPLSRGRFVREAEITGGLEHPGIVPVHGLGSYADGRPFYAMRLIQGETLQEAIKKYHAGDPGWTLRALLMRFLAVCNTVAYAHSRGVLHRDLKPANVMLGKYGETLLLDWGLAKPLAETPAPGAGDATVAPALVPGLVDGIATQAGSALGTPAYMSPEQAAGRVDRLGPASDVYSLGATLYALLTGRPPVETQDPGEMLARAQRGDWPAPRQLNPAVPRALDAVCLKAMALEPGQRYGTALELAADVERWLADEPVAAWREPWRVRGRRWLGRHRTLVGSAAAAALVAIVGLTVGLVLLAAAADKEAQARKKAEEKENEATAKRNETRRTLYTAQMHLVQRAYEENNIAHVRELLEAQTSWPEGAEDLRGFEWYYWDRLAHREVRTLYGHDGGVRRVAVSPDGKRIACCGTDGTVQVWDAATGQERLRLQAGQGHLGSVAFSPDGRHLASSGQGGTVKVWDAGSGQEVRTIKAYTNRVNSVAFSPDSRRLASGSDDSTARVWDIATGKEALALKGHTDVVESVVFSPDGRRIASGSDDNTVKLWDAGTGQEVRTLKGHTHRVNSVAFSPDSQRIASGSDDSTARVWDIATGKEALTLKGHTDPFNSVAFSPDGRRLASGCDDSTVKVWDAGSGQEILALKGHTQGVISVAFSPDGRRLVSSGDFTVKVWENGSDQQCLTLTRQFCQVTGVTFSPDGTRLAGASINGTLGLWDAASGQETLSRRGYAALLGMTFSPDGRRIASGEGQNIRAWDAGSGQELLTLKGHADLVNSVAFSPDGRRLASGSSDRTVKVWDADSGKEVLTLKVHTNGVGSVAFSPDGRHLAGGGNDDMVRIWDAADGQETFTLQGHRPVTSVAFSPDGRRLASGAQFSAVKIWDAADGKEVLTLDNGHRGNVTCVAFSPDGRRLASGGADSTVKVWDAGSGQEVLSLTGHTAGVVGVAFSPDGRRLAGACGDGTVRVWETQPLSAEDLERRAVVALVQDLFDRLLLRSEVVAQLRKDPTLDAATREAALQVAQTTSEDHDRLNDAAWDEVKAPGGKPEAYARGVRLAEAAVQAVPGNGDWLNTLGVAYYRLGDYAKALETLEQADKIHAAKDGSVPEDLAFLATAHQQLGHKEQAKATLARLRELMKQPPQPKDAESLGFLHEAEELIDGKPADKKP